MDLSPSTQGEQKNEQPQQVSSHSPSAQHTSWPPTVYGPHSSHTRTEQCITVSDTTQMTTSTHSQSSDHFQSSISANTEQIEASPQDYDCLSTPPAKRVCFDSPQQLNSISATSIYPLSTGTRSTIASSSQTTPAGSQYLDFSDVYRTLYQASPKWYNLGLALGLDAGTLNIIEHDNKECETCLRKALDQRHAIRRLTWAEIDQALRQPTVQMNTLADEIQMILTKSLSTSSSQPSSDPTPECVVRYTTRDTVKLTVCVSVCVCVCIPAVTAQRLQCDEN